ncbi:unnamed protein product [Ostreobium quekettii]|uniref:RING-type domain-containing protein n=1 Tax=Ostreobium quekettii TaxID=121088 RepID=A0A8S1J279_9CHLO|nr:unnamed protein product [Ostreobium quekettii]
MEASAQREGVQEMGEQASISKAANQLQTVPSIARDANMDHTDRGASMDATPAGAPELGCHDGMLSQSASAAQLPLGYVYVPSRPIAECLACDICKDILKDPHTCLVCLHTYCFACIWDKIELGNAANKCPVDGCGQPDVNGLRATMLGANPFGEEKQTLRHDAALNAIIVKIFPRPGLDERLEEARLKREEQYRCDVRDAELRAMRRHSSGRLTGAKATPRAGRQAGNSSSHAGGTPGLVPAATPAAGEGNPTTAAPRAHRADAGKLGVQSRAPGVEDEWMEFSPRHNLRQTADRLCRKSLERQMSMQWEDSPAAECRPGTSSPASTTKRRPSEASDGVGTGKKKKQGSGSWSPSPTKKESTVAIAVFPVDFFHSERKLPALEFSYFRVPLSMSVAGVGELVESELALGGQQIEGGLDLICRERHLDRMQDATLKVVQEEIWTKGEAEEELLTFYFAAKGG